MDLLLIRKASGSQKSQACTRQGSLLGKLQTRVWTRSEIFDWEESYQVDTNLFDQDTASTSCSSRSSTHLRKTSDLYDSNLTRPTVQSKFNQNTATTRFIVFLFYKKGLSP
mmetsp:Transcript_16778/g.68621  ORF Transcript_16778/g.68621 Transcript_16778/m.68621 type:complete len:111 (-) Transcript_16778:7-339(-)